MATVLFCSPVIFVIITLLIYFWSNSRKADKESDRVARMMEASDMISVVIGICLGYICFAFIIPGKILSALVICSVAIITLRKMIFEIIYKFNKKS